MVTDLLRGPEKTQYERDTSVPSRVRFFTAGMAVAFIAIGLSKVFGFSPQYEFFKELGLPGGMVPVIGVIEILVGALCFHRKTQSYGACGVILLMGAASLTHVMSGARLYMLFINAYFIVGAIWVVRMERPRFLQVRVPERAPRHT
jgi:hypothetical protein